MFCSVSVCICVFEAAVLRLQNYSSSMSQFYMILPGMKVTSVVCC